MNAIPGLFAHDEDIARPQTNGLGISFAFGLATKKEYTALAEANRNERCRSVRFRVISMTSEAGRQRIIINDGGLGLIDRVVANGLGYDHR